MKGTLHKTEQGWIVEYAKHSQLPLHPDQTKYMHLTGKKPNGTFIHDGNEVEFEIVKKVPSEHDVTHGTFVVYKNYAKLINFQTVPLPVFQQLPTSVLEQDVVETMARDFYWSRQPKGKFMVENSRPDMVIGYVEGYNKAKETLYTDLINWIDNEILLNEQYKDSPRLKEGATMVKVHIQSLKQHE
jgi:hypothetical protein